jgi:hypothetical protein
VGESVTSGGGAGDGGTYISVTAISEVTVHRCGRDGGNGLPGYLLGPLAVDVAEVELGDMRGIEGL